MGFLPFPQQILMMDRFSHRAACAIMDAMEKRPGAVFSARREAFIPYGSTGSPAAGYDILADQVQEKEPP